jgi:uncharacterized repeat protein (TIGR03833 family)
MESIKQEIAKLEETLKNPNLMAGMKANLERRLKSLKSEISGGKQESKKPEQKILIVKPSHGLDQPATKPTTSDKATFNRLFKIGMGKPTGIEATEWSKAKEIVENAVTLGWVDAFDFGQDKPKYTTSKKADKTGLTITKIADKVWNKLHVDSVKKVAPSKSPAKKETSSSVPYLIVETWNGEGYSDDNGIREIKKFTSNVEAKAYTKTLIKTTGLVTEDEPLENGWSYESADDYGSFQFFKLKPSDYGLIVFTNVNEAKVLNESSYTVALKMAIKQFKEFGLEDFNDIEDKKNGKDRYFFSNEELNYKQLAGDTDESDYQFQKINNPLSEKKAPAKKKSTPAPKVSLADQKESKLKRAKPKAKYKVGQEVDITWGEEFGKTGKVEEVYYDKSSAKYGGSGYIYSVNGTSKEIGEANISHKGSLKWLKEVTLIALDKDVMIDRKLEDKMHDSLKWSIQTPTEFANQHFKSSKPTPNPKKAPAKKKSTIAQKKASVIIEKPIGIIKEDLGKPAEINKFIEYVSGFYGKQGIYAKDFNGGFTKTQIEKAVSKYISDPKTNWGDGDSVDRELMRDRYLIPLFHKKPTKKKKSTIAQKKASVKAKATTLYLIKYDGASGTNLQFITEASSPADAKKKFYSYMGVTDKIKSDPIKVASSYVKNVKKIDGKYWRVSDYSKPVKAKAPAPKKKSTIAQKKASVKAKSPAKNNQISRSELSKGLSVKVEPRSSRGSIVAGTISDILTKSETHPYGILVRLKNGIEGRVKEIAKVKAPAPAKKKSTIAQKKASVKAKAPAKKKAQAKKKSSAKEKIEALRKNPKYKEMLKGRTDKEISSDLKRKALPEGKRISKDGNVYYERRPEKSDKDGRRQI